MITLITGAPGAGKTAALVDMLAQVDPARLLYVSGVPDLALPGRTVHELEDVATWPDTVPDGALVIIDEVQRVWRPRPAGQAVPPDIAALETHRHRGLDFIIVTQNPGLLHKNVRSLTGRHVHLRDVGYLGRWWYEWPECAENCLTGWRTAPIKKRYRLPRRVLNMYRSASMHIKGQRSFPMMALVGILALVAAAAAAWYAGKSILSKSSSSLSVMPTATPDSALTALSSSPATDQRGRTENVASGPSSTLPLIDDRIDWFPRVSTRPESAPAYDRIREVRSHPVVAGGVCIGAQCRCYTQQATDAGLSSDACREWIERPPFDAYRTDAEFWPAPVPAQAAPVPVPEQGKPGEPENTAFKIPID